MPRPSWPRHLVAIMGGKVLRTTQHSRFVAALRQTSAMLGTLGDRCEIHQKDQGLSITKGTAPGEQKCGRIGQGSATIIRLSSRFTAQ